MRALLLISFSLALMGQAHAQTPAATPAPASAPQLADVPAPPVRGEKRIEHIVIEDKGNRIEETRYGGETQSITVKPLNSALPAYEIVPANGARNRPIGERDTASGNSGQRVWKLFGF